jgi:very-short-patch-repair endonuclease
VLAKPEVRAHALVAAHSEVARAKRSRAMRLLFQDPANHPKWKGGPAERECLFCKIPFKVPAFRIRNGCGKYCSEKCSADFRRSTGMCRLPRPQIVCPVCHVSFQPKRSSAQNHGKPRRFCSTRCVNIYRLTLVRRIGTRIEGALESVLVNLGVVYEKQKPLLGVTVADFFVPPNHVVYADGDYWHSLPEVQERDCRINLRLQRAGYSVFRFPESRINENINNVQQELSNALC